MAQGNSEGWAVEGHPRGFGGVGGVISRRCSGGEGLVFWWLFGTPLLNTTASSTRRCKKRDSLSLFFSLLGGVGERDPEKSGGGVPGEQRGYPESRETTRRAEGIPEEQEVSRRAERHPGEQRVSPESREYPWRGRGCPRRAERYPGDGRGVPEEQRPAPGALGARVAIGGTGCPCGWVPDR